ncbi:MAG: response regulator [Methylococcales bacterium]|jgi:two-component system, NtrC family, sensor kinase|nr:response regulator [Methylococcales bacterium]MBT7408652.1 response regulator [Methylococcales bacterium]
MNESKQAKLLIVDDMKINVTLLQRVLSVDYQVFIATSGVAALEVAETNLPDLILLDILMPGMDGYQVFKALKENEKTQDIPVIFITSLDEDHDETAGLQMGAIDYITKPFNVLVVKNRIHSHLERLNNQDKLRQLVDAKQQQLIHSEKLSSLGTLMAGIIHEINNPMTYVSGNLKFLQRYFRGINAFHQGCEKLITETAEKLGSDVAGGLLEQFKTLDKETVKSGKLLVDCEETLEDCLEGTDRISNIIKNLKFFSHQSDDQKEICDVNECIDMSIKLANNELKYKVKLHKNYAEIPKVKASSLQLSQVFINLMVNAAHAIDKQGDINLTTCFQNGSVIITIADNGSGIAEDKLKKIFEPFFTTKEAGVGTGLGLSICHDIIEMHHGSITVESQVDVGTTFTIKIPAEEID